MSATRCTTHHICDCKQAELDHMRKLAGEKLEERNTWIHKTVEQERITKHVQSERDESIAALVTAQQQVRDLRAALEKIAQHPCAGHLIRPCIEHQQLVAENPHEWPDDYVVSTREGRYFCDRCVARAALAATAEPEAVVRDWRCPSCGNYPDTAMHELGCEAGR